MAGSKGERMDFGPAKGRAAPRPEPEDDFFCLRFGVWYPSLDCAIRTKYRTSPSCLRCDQGRFNLKRHAPRLAYYRFPLPSAEPD